MFYIRKMNRSDLSAIWKIESEIQVYPWTKGMFRDCLKNECYEGFVVEDKNYNKVCAYLVTQSILDECHILTIGVKKSRQKQGLALQLLTFLFEQKAKDSARILLEVAESNIPAVHLYKKLGFHQIGLRKNYYQNTVTQCSDNALIFERELLSG